MSWIRHLKYQELDFSVNSGSPFDDMSEVVGFYIRDESTITAIRSRDNRILDLLNLMVDEIEDVSLGSWANDSMSFEHWSREKSLDEYEEILKNIVNNKYADQEAKETATSQLDWVEKQRRQKIERKAKGYHSNKRRSQFAKNYDQLMLALIERDGYKCKICGTTEDLTIDHIVPLSKGGSDEIDNLRLLCRTHNSSKGDK